MITHSKFLQTAEWFKSSASEGFGECLEVSFLTVVVLRDSKDPDGPCLYFTGPEWDAFMAGAHGGEFDRR